MSNSAIIRPQDLNQIYSSAKMKKMDEMLEFEKKKQQISEELRKAFMAREVHPEAIDRINAAVRRAAEQGQHQLQVVTFPNSFCTDRGRCINNNDPDWPSTLTGFAKKAYDYFEKELRPLGYKVTAEIVTWPDGLPGDVALNLKW
jgi:hypothetical protein